MKPLRSETANDLAASPAASGPIGSGWKHLQALVGATGADPASKSRPLLVGIDGYVGTQWADVEKVIREIPKTFFEQVEARPGHRTDEHLFEIGLYRHP